MFTYPGFLAEEAVGHSPSGLMEKRKNRPQWLLELKLYLLACSSLVRLEVVIVRAAVKWLNST